MNISFSVFKKRQAFFTRSELLGAVIVAILFTLSLVFSRIYEEEIAGAILTNGALGQIMYVALCVAGVVFAPIVSLALLPIAVTAWGSLATAAFTALGWWVGTIVAFNLAKKYGQDFVSKLVPIRRAKEIARRVTEKNRLVILTLLHYAIPTDILSYVVGLLVPVRATTYAYASLIGTLPSALIFSYGVTLPPTYQAVAAATLLLVVITISVVTVIHEKDDFEEEN